LQKKLQLQKFLISFGLVLNIKNRILSKLAKHINRRNELVSHCLTEKLCLLHTKNHLKLNFRKNNNVIRILATKISNELPVFKNAIISSATFGLNC